MSLKGIEVNFTVKFEDAEAENRQSIIKQSNAIQATFRAKVIIAKTLLKIRIPNTLPDS